MCVFLCDRTQCKQTAQNDTRHTEYCTRRCSILSGDCSWDVASLTSLRRCEQRVAEAVVGSDASGDAGLVTASERSVECLLLSWHRLIGRKTPQVSSCASTASQLLRRLCHLLPVTETFLRIN